MNIVFFHSSICCINYYMLELLVCSNRRSFLDLPLLKLLSYRLLKGEIRSVSQSITIWRLVRSLNLGPFDYWARVVSRNSMHLLPSGTHHAYKIHFSIVVILNFYVTAIFLYMINKFVNIYFYVTSILLCMIKTFVNI